MSMHLHTYLCLSVCQPAASKQSKQQALAKQSKQPMSSTPKEKPEQVCKSFKTILYVYSYVCLQTAIHCDKSFTVHYCMRVTF